MERFASKFCTRDDSALNEGTRDPIFLLLVETAQLLDYSDEDRPEGWTRNDDGELVHEVEGECMCHLSPPCSFCVDSNRPVTFAEIKAQRANEVPITIETRVHSVWLTRAEAEAWLASHKYRFGSDQHAYVYCVCAEGELSEVLRDGSSLAEKRAQGGK